MVPPSQSLTVQVAVEALDRLAYASVKTTLLHLATGKSRPPPPPPPPPSPPPCGSASGKGNMQMVGAWRRCAQ